MHDLIRAYKALSDETRLRMLNLLLERECCGCEVMQALDISQTRASRNLNLLYEAGLLKRRKAGLWSYYSIDRDNLELWRLTMLDAVAQGLKDNPTARKDLVRLKNALKQSQSCLRQVC